MPAQPTGAPHPRRAHPATSAAVMRTATSASTHTSPFCSVRLRLLRTSPCATEASVTDGLGTYAADIEILFAARTLEASGVANALCTPSSSEAAPPINARPSTVRILQAAIDVFGLVEGRRSHHRSTPSCHPRRPANPQDGGFHPRNPSACSLSSPRCYRYSDRTHTPSSVPKVVAWAKACRCPVDLIYGSPGGEPAAVGSKCSRRNFLRADHISRTL